MSEQTRIAPVGGWVSTATLARHLEVSTRTIRARVRDGTLPPPIDLGGVKRFDLSAVEARLRGAQRATVYTIDDAAREAADAARKTARR